MLTPLTLGLGLRGGPSGGGGAIPESPTNLVPPERAGLGGEFVGDVIELTTAGEWTGDPVLSYQWFVSGEGDIEGQIGVNLTVTEALANKSIGCRVTATNAGGSLSLETSAQTTRELFLTNTGSPVASTNLFTTPSDLSCDGGTWESNPLGPTITYQWYGPLGALGSGSTETGYDAGFYYCDVTAVANYSGATPTTVSSNTIELTTPE